mmetsp:Transcript_152297/g.277094  ORF Transcript_152297/g.277094 Transcript_152297/m.277094 type:complete len:326 (-) Transcript_152297:73-1050(-)
MYKITLILTAGFVCRGYGRRVHTSLEKLPGALGESHDPQAAFNPTGTGGHLPSRPTLTATASHPAVLPRQSRFDHQSPVGMTTAVAPTNVSARESGLALALDDGTRKSHSMAENTQFVTGFFKGISTRDAFSELVASLYFVYRSMEEAFDTAQDANVKALDYPELRRLKSLEEDMAYYFGDNWKQTVKPSKGTQEYCDRIATIAREEPPLLIAHMYTRYLGDLFGGQMMGGMARSSLKLDQSRGTRFYEFDDIPNNKKFIEGWYSKLNELDLSEKQKQEIVDEANLVFTLNIKLFDELSGGKMATIKAFWKLAMNAVKSKLKKLR